MVLFRAQVVELLEREGLVARKEGIPVALELDDVISASLDLLLRPLGRSADVFQLYSIPRSSSRVISSSAAIS
jgi:hypothetical protein